MKTCILVILLMFTPRNLILKDFCQGWLATTPAYRFQLAPGLYHKLTMKEKQQLWQARKKHKLSGIRYDVTGDGIVNFKDFAILAEYYR